MIPCKNIRTRQTRYHDNFPVILLLAIPAASGTGGAITNRACHASTLCKN
jgi:hypothetical protein